MEENNNKRVTILLGRGIDRGDTFSVVGEARTLGEARRMTRTREFVSEHLGNFPEGAYVLLVSGGGHQIFLPISSLFMRGSEEEPLGATPALELNRAG